MFILDITFDIARSPSSEEEARANSHLTEAFRAATDNGMPVLVGVATDDSGNLKFRTYARTIRSDGFLSC
jgi:hypothetical protein